MLTRRQRRGFLAFLYTQFFGAFDDNVYRWAVALSLVERAGKEDAEAIQALTGLLFSLPFLLFIPYGGFLADRFRKKTLVVATAWMEVFLLLVCSLGWFWNEVYLAGVFLMGLQSALFSPAKYGILPELVPKESLVRANSWVSGTTMLAIILGGVVGGYLVQELGLAATVGVVTLCSASAALVSFRVTPTEAAAPDREFSPVPAKELVRGLVELSRIRVLFAALGALTLFWFLGRLVESVLPILAQFTADIKGEGNKGLLLGIFSTGIAAGSLIPSLLRPATAVAAAPLSTIGMALAALFLFAYGRSFETIGAGLFALGLFGGFFHVPVSALFQEQCPPDRRGRFLAAQGWMTFAGIFVASAAYWGLSKVVESREIFLAVAALGLGMGAVQILGRPESLAWVVVRGAVRLVFRLRVEDSDKVPAEGGVLLAANHVSYVDPLVIMAASPRPVRFLIDRTWNDRWWVRMWTCFARVIPVRGDATSRAAIAAAREAVRQGDAVVIFPEGGITRVGAMLPFRRGIEWIARETGTPIVPAHIDGLYGTVFSPRCEIRGRLRSYLPRHSARVRFGDPMPPDASAEALREEVLRLESRSFLERVADRRPLPEEFLRIARRNWFRRAMSDSTGASLTYGSLLIRAVILSQILRRGHPNEKNLGLLLPSTVAGAVVNLAVTLAGKVSVNLNWTIGKEAFDHCVRKAGLRTILTSRRFLEKAGIQARPEVVYLEGLAEQVTPLKKLAWAAVCALLPARRLAALLRVEAFPSDLATIIFSSGTTGVPKGVMLTHRNLLSNCLATEQMFLPRRDDCVVGCLPFFHSFGYSMTIWLPILAEIRAAYHPNPLDGRGVAETVAKAGGTILLATPTFLQIYTRQARPEEMRTLRHVFTGAEKLPIPVAQAFAEKFGVLPREGYGCTELSPVVSLNVPDAPLDGWLQKGTKPGSIGRPIPGVLVRLDHPETGRPVPRGEEGVLLVRGPNVMWGYLGEPEKTAEALRDGWYVTGDIARMDEDGFLTLTDRQSRFSKIGGEMVPHIRVEEAIQKVIGGVERVVAVTGVPDSERGERLVVLHAVDLDPERVIEKLRAEGLPPIWIPRRDAFRRIEALPLLGSGKVDLGAIRKIASQ